MPNRPPTASRAADETIIRISGRVRKPLELNKEELLAMEVEEFEDLFLICGSGEPRGSISSCRGVLLETVVRVADVLKEEHNDTKKMYLIASAEDGHKVVFSWQELFNTPVGGGIMIIFEKDGEPLDRERNRLDLISVQDYFMGARYVKRLTNIEVAMVS